MDRSDLTKIQKQILLLVREEEGRTATESIYDIVENARPTIDEDGESLDGLDPFETSREEIGALERAGLLAQDDDGGPPAAILRSRTQGALWPSRSATPRQGKCVKL